MSTTPCVSTGVIVDTNIDILTCQGFCLKLNHISCLSVSLSPAFSDFDVLSLLLLLFSGGFFGTTCT